jgi:hypothetical protein
MSVIALAVTDTRRQGSLLSGALARHANICSMPSNVPLPDPLAAAIRQRDLATARQISARRAAAGETVPLEHAAALTLMLLDHDANNYEAAARRLIERLAGETAAGLGELVDIAAMLEALLADPTDMCRPQLIEAVRHCR